MLAVTQSGFPWFLPFFGVFGALMVFVVAVGMGFFILPIIALVHVLVRDDMGDTQKLVWALLVFFIPFLWLVYFVLGRERTSGIFADL